jgi:molecular chaperone GrpE
MPRIPIDDNNPDQQPPTQPDAAQGTAAPDAARQDGAGKGNRNDDELQSLRAERDSLFDRLARTTADFRNTQKRLEQEMDQRVQYANSSLIKSLLPVIDNFERALAVDPSKADAASILKGMQIVHDQWMNVLGQQQVQEIAPAPGTPFDPNLHQALMQQDAVYPVPTVVQLLQKGYALHGRTLRPAQVAVSKSV